MNNLLLQLELQFIIEDFVFNLKNKNNISPILIENALKSVLLKIQDEISADLLSSLMQQKDFIEKENDNKDLTEQTISE